jgi:plasmid stabilization system protein ParE
MAKLVYSPRALSDIGRFFDFLAGQDPRASSVNFEYFNSRVGSLARAPLMGREVKTGIRKLVVRSGRSGYVVIYRFGNVRCY